MVTLSCEQCGKKFERLDSDAARGRIKYCSAACYHIGRKGKPRGSAGCKTERRECPICGAIFSVGGRGHRPRKTIFCGWKCSRRARFRNGTVGRQISEIEAAYLAGIVDGEGSIILYLNQDVVCLRITIANTNLQLLEWVRKTTAVGSIVIKPSKNQRHKHSGQWAANSSAAESIIRQIRPFLVIKTIQADLALETIQRLRNPVLKADRSWQSEYWRRMKTLNARGPAKGTAQL